ncbi:MAG: hypothetical protein LKG19_11745 [Saprospiraceae bacterium]|jgi:hypothetical protein|nr:hypothetical protein [Saprospiraceae bacterium]
MNEEFLTFQKFNDLSETNELCALLKENMIEFELEDNFVRIDPSFSNNDLSKEYRIKLRKLDFEKAENLIQEQTKILIDSVEKDYYLFDFNDEELLEIITKRDEWGQFDFMLAQKILKDRGKEINPEVVELLKKQRLEELAKPEESQKTWILAGYIMAVLGGLFGMFIGWHLASHKKTLPNGDKIYGFSLKDREHGNRILIIGIISTLIWVFFRIIKVTHEQN